MNDKYTELKAIPGEEKTVDFDEDTDCHGVFGVESGFCYSLHCSYEAATKALRPDG